VPSVPPYSGQLDEETDMADSTLADLLNAFAAMRAELMTSFAALRTDREKLGDDITAAMGREQAGIMSRMDGMEDRLTALLRNLGANCRHVDYVDQKVDNLRDETRLGGRATGEIMALVRALEARVAKLEQGKG
jgi:uncharacterized membrane-anchored protein